MRIKRRGYLEKQEGKEIARHSSSTTHGNGKVELNPQPPRHGICLSKQKLRSFLKCMNTDPTSVGAAWNYMKCGGHFDPSLSHSIPSSLHPPPPWQPKSFFCSYPIPQSCK
ncbi:hypothetical protein CEXT_672421 [Caerostris extrusa]|uniref:Uncharacterized protein n=1 Tax=Caerostris extrusa TaxID=172846 RepID=A0AAV4P2S7_CAEEX|nr:hypothetical protein CEXT_672421 [Caerostris extrusa]